MRLLLGFTASLLLHSLLLFAFLSLNLRTQPSEERAINLSSVRIEKSPPKGVVKKVKRKTARADKPKLPEPEPRSVRKAHRTEKTVSQKPHRRELGKEPPKTNEIEKTASSSPSKTDREVPKRETTDPKPYVEQVSGEDEWIPPLEDEPEGSQAQEEDYTRLYREENLAKIREAIISYLRYPPVARRMGWEGTVVVRFVLSPGGEIEESEIVKSSGFKLLDRNALKVVVLASKEFPIPERRVVVELPIVYRLE